MIYTVSFSRNIPTFGMSDFEKLFLTSSKPLKEILKRFESEKISNVSSIKIYEGSKLSNKSVPAFEIPCPLDFETRILYKIKNNLI